MIHTGTNKLIGQGWLSNQLEFNDKKAYSIKCYTKEDWVFIHEELEKDGSLEDNIPDPSIVCPDKKEHSDTRATYMLTDAEAEDLRKHEKVQWVCIDYDVYPGNYSPDPKDNNGCKDLVDSIKLYLTIETGKCSNFITYISSWYRCNR